MQFRRFLTTGFVFVVVCLQGRGPASGAEPEGVKAGGQNERPAQETKDSSSPMVVPSEIPGSSQTNKASSKFDLNANANSFELGTAESVVAWEAWHQHIGKLLSKRINHSIGTMLGSSVVQIKIDCDHNVFASLLESTGSKDFGAKSLEAAQSLDRSPELEFPPQSKRKSVTFNYKFKRKLFTIPSMKFIKDDYEHVGE